MGSSAGDLTCCALNVGGIAGDTTRPPGLLGVVNQAFSHGRVAIHSANPEDHPAIEQNLLTDELDVVRFRTLFSAMAEILRRPPLDSIVDSVFDSGGRDVDLDLTGAALDLWGRGRERQRSSIRVASGEAW